MAYLYMQILRQVAVCFEIQISNSKFLQLTIASNYITSSVASCRLLGTWATLVLYNLL